jgi:tetratricopeptide (TPR) repeat protein
VEEHVEQLAYHYERSKVDEKAVEYLLRAGEKARRAYLNEEAIGYFQRALERLDEPVLRQPHKESRLAALARLGQIYHGVGRVSEAEEQLRQAIRIGREIGLPPRELVRLYFWLGEALWWQNRSEEVISLGEEGLALLGEASESVEVALMNATVAVGGVQRGDRERWREFNSRNVPLLQRLPYSEELRAAYHHIAMMYRQDNNGAEAMKWAEALEQQAQQHYDLRALGTAHLAAFDILVSSGDLAGAISRAQQALEVYTKIGDEKDVIWCLSSIGQVLLSLGDLQKAEKYRYQTLKMTEDLGNRTETAWSYWKIGAVSLAQRSWEKATDAFQRAAQLFREVGGPPRGEAAAGEAAATLALGQVHLARGKRQEAARLFRDALKAAGGMPAWPFAVALSRLEEACGEPAAFHAFCHRFREEHPEAVNSSFLQWFLEPTAPLAFPQSLVDEAFASSLSSDWVWHDPFGDGALVVQNGLEIHAANGRDLWHVNLSAPRLNHPIGRLCSGSRNFAAQTVCVPTSVERPVMGGLLIWKDRENFLRLDRGAMGRHSIAFVGCLRNQEVIVGRGRLPAERIVLRLERTGDGVNALCSADGREWFAVGHAGFPVQDPVLVGLYAIGVIDRTIYPGAYPEGTAIRFESFEVWS